MADIQGMERARSGWKEEETDLLLLEVKKAESEGRPMKSVFEQVAMLTGRKPNSIRNYYYLKLKDEQELFGKISTFIPFEPKEMEQLVKTMLTEQAKGKSVRSIALQMGNGDKKAMLRYQNKYRSILKSNPQMIREAIAQLRREGKPYMDPYEQISKRKKAGGSGDIAERISQMARYAAMAGEDSTQLMKTLCSLTKKAAQFTAQKEPIDHMRFFDELQEANLSLAKEEGKRKALEEQNRELREQLEQVSKNLGELQKKHARLLEHTGELIALNQRFIGLKGMVRLSGLSDYTAAIQACLTKLD